MKTFNEYLNSKGKVESGTVDIHGDRVDPMNPPNKPPKDKNPYVAKGEKNSTKALGDHGNKDLKYKPDTGKDSKKAANIPTAEVFAQYELVPLISESLEQNPNLAEQIVRDLKNKGLLGVLVGELMDHRETYKHIAKLIEHESGESIRKKLTRALEEVSPAYSSRSEEEDLEKTGLEDVDVDDDTMDLDIEDDDAFDDEEDFEIDDTDEFGDMNGMGNGATDPTLKKPMPTFQQAMMSKM